MFSQSQVLEVVYDQLFPIYRKQRNELDVVDSWYRWDHELPQLPSRASAEHKWLAQLSQTPWLNLVVTTVAQALYGSAYRSSVDSSPWQIWKANGFDRQQTAIHRDALAYGVAYNVVMPGRSSEGRRSLMRGVSPRKMVAVYQDSANDDWPMLAAEFDRQGQNFLVRVYDDEADYYVQLGASGDDPKFIQSGRHGAGVTPIVRYTNMLDLDGRSSGEVVPLIPVAKRIDKTDYDRLLGQHFNSWKVRVISGIDVTASGSPTGDVDDPAVAAERAQTRLRQNDTITLKDPASKAYTLDETSLEGFIKARQSDVQDLAAVAQVPVTALNGGVSNISAEALVELRAGLNQKVFERQMSFGHSHVQSLRLAAHLEGNEVAANDFEARLDWRDTRVRPWGQTVDALGKAAQMLGVPVESLWGELPWVDQTDLEDLKRGAGSAAAQQTRSRLAEAAAAAMRNPAVANVVNGSRSADAG